MGRARRALPRSLGAMPVLAATIGGQDQKERPGGAQGGPSAATRRGLGFIALPTPNPSKTLIFEAKPVPSCKLAAATAVAARDAIDDPKALPGTAAEGCDEFTQTGAALIRRLRQGQPVGADLNALPVSGGSPSKPPGFCLLADGLNYFTTQNPQSDCNTITPAACQRFWDQSAARPVPARGEAQGAGTMQRILFAARDVRG